MATQRVSVTAEAGDDAFVEAAVDWLSTSIREAVDSRGKCVIGLSGGSTPGPIYEALGKETLPWDKVFVFLVDERHVPPENADSNTNLQRRTLLAQNQVPSSNVVFPDCSLPIGECVDDYAAKLQKLFADHGQADILTLGLGPDGHYASLFPPVSADILASTAGVVHTTTEKFAVFDRITITQLVIKEAGRYVFFFKGAEKLAVWDEMIKEFANESNETRWPAHGIVNTGKVTVVSQS